jgi:tetratricopeptide (TPR) repeat protein
MRCQFLHPLNPENLPLKFLCSRCILTTKDFTMSSQTDEKATQRWMNISELVLRARVEARAIDANQALEHYIDEDPKGAAAPAMAIWRADNFVFDRFFDEGARAHEEAARRHAQDSFNGVSWGAYALDQAASCHEQAGRVDDALKAVDSISLLKDRGSEAWVHFRRAKILEAAGRDSDAIDAYRKAETSPDKPGASGVEIRELARRGADRRKLSPKLEPFPDRLATTISRALQKRDLKALDALASTTHFTLGLAGSELKLIDYQKIAPYLRDDLGKSQLRIDTTTAHCKGKKIYVYTDDWKGNLLRGRVYFLLTRSRDGWQWSGLVLTQIGGGYFELFPPQPPAKNQVPQIVVKAPFPAGVCFRAGGLRRFIESFLPFVGAATFFTDNFSGCGYGPGGFYYNEGSTHQGQEAFAIDFTRYATFLPYVLAAGGIHALAVQAGVVTMVRSFIASGDATLENRVQIDHPSLGELLALLFGRPLPAALRFQSWYLHLAGPGAIFVSPGMFVRQGARLGPIDDTGFSAFDHLHFSLHDRDLVAGGVPYQSVRPTPMDGQPLGDGNHGSCVCSTNVPFP